MSTQKNMLEEEKKIEEEKTVEKQKFNLKDFYQRFRNDKRFHAKVELVVYVVFIVVIILVVNFANLSSDSSYSSNNAIDNLSDSNDNITEEEMQDLYNELDYNYEASIEVTTIKDEIISNDSYIFYSYSKDKDLNIIKISSDKNYNYKLTDTGEYYNVDEDVKSVEENEIFDLIPYKYLNLENIQKYISKGTSEYTTNYSNGDKLVSYKIYIKDILLDNSDEGFITINVSTNSDSVTIDIDYTDLLKGDDIDTCNVKVIYKNINNLTISEDDNQDSQS